eukprot:scaffold307101_cov49-Prasinocladus_malaysianus.AAC.2
MPAERAMRTLLSIKRRMKTLKSSGYSSCICVPVREKSWPAIPTAILRCASSSASNCCKRCGNTGRSSCGTAPWTCM